MPFSRFLTVRPKCLTLVPALVAIALAAASPMSATAASPSADLATTISGSPPHAFGYVYYRITVTNNGPDTAYQVVITDTTPARSTFYCGSGTSAACGPAPSGVTCTRPAGSTGTLTCKTASLRPNASVTVWMGVKLGFFWHNQAFGDAATASSATPDPNPSNNTAWIVARVL
jgi:uncharacterized repeat protein (TIGR01451 family)